MKNDHRVLGKGPHWGWGISVRAILALCALLACASNAGAGEIDDLRRQLAEQNRLLQEMARRLNELENRQNNQDAVIEQKVSSAVENKKIDAIPDGLKWAEKVKISGDLRYRHEHIDAEENGNVSWKKGRDRHRIRARLNIDGKVNDEWDVGMRLAGGEREILADEGDMFADPVSSNQTLKQYFSSKDIWIDLAYFNWHPESHKGLNVLGGKIENPFYNVGGNQLIWDGDLNPEGIAAQYVMPFGENNQVFINGGGFWVDESSSGADASLWGIQGYIKHAIGEKDHILGGLSYYNYGNVKGMTDKYGILAGNTADPTGTMWAGDYDLIEVFSEYGTKLGNLPFALFANWVQNTAAATDQDKGWLAGFKLNKAKAPGSWEFGYNYRKLEADAVFAAFTDSDFIGGGTDGRGHQFSFKYQLAKNLQAALTYFHNEVDRSAAGRDLDYRRLQADLILKF